MVAVSKETIVKYEELPVINGVCIKAIYAYQRNENYYRCTDAPSIEKTDYYHCVPYFSKDNSINIKTLPKELADIFGNQVYGEDKIHVTHMSYRTSCSGNGSFTDDTMDICGSRINGTRSSFSIYRGVKYDIGVPLDSELGKKMLNTLRKKYTVEECKIWEYTFDPCTHLRNEGGLNYPDYACQGWRRPHKMPYVTYDKCKTFRVYFEPMNMHVYLERIDEPLEKGDVFVMVDFSRERDEWDKFCFINHWADTKQGCANEIIRYKVDSVSRDKKRLTVYATDNADKTFFKKDIYRDSYYYRIVNMKSIS